MTDTKANPHARRARLAAAFALALALCATAAAQSTDAENPTPMTSGVVAGKSNGKAKTVYYSFTATAADGGEVKVKVTASTDERSTHLRVNFLDEDGQRVMDEIYVIPNRDPATKVGRHTFAERRRVVMRVTLPDDPQVKLLDYRIEVTGAVEFETPEAKTASEGGGASPGSEAGADPPADGGGAQAKTTARQKVSKAAKKIAKDTPNEAPKDGQR
jgi:hypothetical protein